MINSSDPTRRRSAYEIIGQLRAASVLIRRSFAASLSVLGNAAQARAILLRGLQLEPDSEQLRYLAPILVREGVVQASELELVSAK